MKIMAVDLGDARTGIACCDRTEFLASPVCVIEERMEDALLDKVEAAALELDAKLVVIGHPINMNGSEGPRAQHSAAFAEKLKERLSVPVELWDERGTTVMAHNALNVTNVRGQKRKGVVDAVAAVLILENYLTYRRAQGLSS